MAIQTQTGLQAQVGLLAPQGGGTIALLTYSPVAVPAGSLAGQPAGTLSSTLASPAFSVLSGNLTVNSSAGSLTTTATAPSFGTIAAHVRVQNAGNTIAEELTIAVPISAGVPTAPSAPTLISVTPASGQNTLVFTNNSTGGSPLTGNNLYRGTVSGGEVLIGSIGTGSPYIDTGLTNGTTYYYELTATNAIGESVKSNELSGTPTSGSVIVSASKRVRIGPLAGITVGVNNVHEVRLVETNATGTTNTWFEYFNGWVNTGLTGPQEVGSGSAGTIRCYLQTGITGSAYNQPGSSVSAFAFSNIVNSVSGYCLKSDNTVTPCTLTNKSYTQFQADGGSIAADHIVVPDSYHIRSDNNVGISAGSSFAIQWEEARPVPVAITTVSQAGAVTTATTASAHGMIDQRYYTTAGFTPSGYNATATLCTVIDATHFSYTAGGSGLGTPSVFGTIDFLRPVTANLLNARGDILKQTNVTGTLVGTTDWSSVNPLLTGNGQQSPCPVALFGNSTTGKLVIGIAGDSNTYVGDINQPNPGGSYFLGDGDGALGYIARFLNLGGYNWVMTGVSGAHAANQNTYGDGQVRLWLTRFCATVYDDMGRNDILGQPSFSAFKAVLTPYYALRRAYTASVRIVTHSFPPYTTSTNSWATRPTNQTQTIASLTYPGGDGYAGVRAGYLDGTFLGVANGGPDAFVDLANIITNASGTVALDGNWAADGSTAWLNTPDGQHMGGHNHAYAATWIAGNVDLATLLGE